jgi:hypothetical protein
MLKSVLKVDLNWEKIMDKEIGIGLYWLQGDWAIGFVSLKYDDATMRGFAIGSLVIGAITRYV